MIELRDYQIDLSNQSFEILKDKHIVYISAEVRVGKTLIALKTADLYGAKKVLFLTKKRAIDSIQSDYNKLEPKYEIQIINNESLHKVTDNDFHLIISDEHHRLSSFPKPNKTTKIVRERFGKLPMIFLSGTPTAESGSQWYHSFWVSVHSPFRQYKNFYQWAVHFTKPKIKYLGAIQLKDYSDAIDELIQPIIKPYLVTYTQKEAGFQSGITEKVIYYEQSGLTTKLVDRLLKDLIIEGKTENIVADTAVKLMSKIHQIENGTIIFDSGNSQILDTTKAEFIKDYFKGKKLAIFYNFKKEYQLLCQVFGADMITDQLDMFNSTDKHIALQQVSGSEGISLKAADCLVYYNYGFSGKNYVQGRDRLTTIDREKNEVFFVFAKKSINERIYRVISKKKRYSDKVFIKDYGKSIGKLFADENP